MVTKKRKFEVHKLTISGLVEGSNYRTVIRNCRRKVRNLGDAVWEHGGKSHALESAELIRDRLQMRFLSYKTGYRPDVLDTDNYKIEPNPLSETQTGVDYTHVLLAKDEERWVLVIEKLQAGIWPNAIGLYLNWMLEQFGVPEDSLLQAGDGIVVSVEPEPGEAFIQRIESLDRVTKATLRIVRPNPAWADLEDGLGEEADDSAAAYADVTMTSKPRETLRKNRGIVGRIKSLFRSRDLGHAVIEGVKGTNREKFNTGQMPKTAFPQVQMDENGQVNPSDAFTRMERMVENLNNIR